MEHQDWEPITIRNPNQNPQQVKKTIQAKHSGSTISKKLDEHGDEFKNKTWNATIQKNVQQLHLGLKLDQKKFAQRLNIPVSEIQNIENKKGIYNGSLVHKINRIFKVSIADEK